MERSHNHNGTKTRQRYQWAAQPICRWTPGYKKWLNATHRAEVPSDDSHYVIPKLPHSCPKVVPNLSQGCLKGVPKLSPCCPKWHPKVFHVLHKWCPLISYHASMRLVECCYQLLCSEKVWISGSVWISSGSGFMMWARLNFAPELYPNTGICNLYSKFGMSYSESVGEYYSNLSTRIRIEQNWT